VSGVIQQIPDFHPAQKLFFESEATEILWGGDTRAGKTAGVKLSLIRWCSLIPGLQCDIFRLREADVIAGYMEGDFGFPSLLADWIRAGKVTCNTTEVKFWNGSHIKLGHCWTDAALTSYQGVPKHVRIVDEAGQIRERHLKWLKLWMTMSNDMKEKIPQEWRHLFPKIIYLMNRMGSSKGYFRNRFVRARPKYKIETVGAFRQQYLPAAVTDNPSEDIEATIARVNEDADSATAKALLSEDGWDAQTGNFFEEWNSDRHVVKDFVVPDAWVRLRTFDYGSYEPWACIFWAISPGVTIHKGTPHERYLPRYCLVAYREWYGCKAEHPTNDRDKGITNLAPLNWSNADIANGVIDRTEERFDGQPTFTDKFPFNNLGGRTIAKDFADAGLKLTLGETDRKNRASLTKSKLAGERLVAGSEERWPMMVFFESCKYCQDYMPMIERHPNEGRPWDYAEDGEATHIVDCITLAAVMNKVANDTPVNIESEVKRAISDKRTTRPSVNDLIPGLQIG
jgi:hypothetical protein